MEEVVLLDEHGHVIGTADKTAVHHQNTPLHLAFSCYVINPRGEFLLTCRSQTKPTWPGTWTNSCCGHPAPGETLTSAVLRRLNDELGITATKVDLILSDFRYHAVMPNGVAENEICPVVRVVYDGPAHPNPDEVDAHRWIPWAEFIRKITNGTLAVSPWCADQLARLRSLGPSPVDWPIASENTLPAAYRNT